MNREAAAPWIPLLVSILGMAFAAPQSLVAQPCRLVLRDICCDRENDWPSAEDELYLLLTVQRLGQPTVTMRIPQEGQFGATTDTNGTHWVMEEVQGRSHHAASGGGLPANPGTFWPLHLFSLNTNESITFTVAFMEQDGLCDTLRYVVTNSVAQSLISDEDDKMGTVTFIIRRRPNGVLQFLPQSIVGNIKGLIDFQPGPWRLGFEYRIGGGEGGPENYVAWFAVQDG